MTTATCVNRLSEFQLVQFRHDARTDQQHRDHGKHQREYQTKHVHPLLWYGLLAKLLEELAHDDLLIKRALHAHHVLIGLVPLAR